MRTSRHTGQTLRDTSAGKHSVPGPPGERTGRGTTPPKKKCSTHFCIRIYYFKGSLKIKILYSIENSLCFFFCVSVNKMVRVVPGARDQLFLPPRRTAWWGHPRALRPPSGVVCSERETTPGLFSLGLERVGETANVTGLDTDCVWEAGPSDTLSNTLRQNETIPILLLSHSNA